ncbi:MAG: diaminopimelate epimerase, partial [Candidatus Omnitrophica bacterium]|nr:diaminopimelate epimerase [Candidatus Omnitrophota bacterium]
HAVLFVPDLEQAPVQSLGAELRRHRRFAPRGTNVNFVQVREPNFILVRTFERGVEGETLACGTGVTAAALVAAQLYQWPSPVKVQVRNGDVLEVRFQQRDGQWDGVRLNGPADFIFEGRISLD